MNNLYLNLIFNPNQHALDIEAEDIQLLRAVQNGSSVEIDRAIREGRNLLQVRDAEGNTVLHAASFMGHANLVRKLIRACPRLVLTPNDFKDTPLHVASVKDQPAILELLIRSGAQVNGTNSSGMAPLHIAAANGCKNNIICLIEAGADKEAKCADSLTPLHHASYGNHLEAARILIEKGVNVNSPDKDLNTPLHWASISGHREMVDLLLLKGAKLDPMNIMGETPLFIACKHGKLKIARFLREIGANIDQKNHKRSTILQSSIQHPPVMAFLLERGAQFTEQEGQKYLEHALHERHSSVAIALIRRGVKISQAQYSHVLKTRLFSPIE